MSKTVTLRLSEDEYEQISSLAKADHRPLSNFITHIVLSKFQESYYVDSAEMTEILNNKELLEDLKVGHEDAKARRGKFVD